MRHALSVFLRSVLLSAAMLLALVGAASAKPPSQVFYPLPEIHDMVLSPDGKRITWVQNTNDGSGDGVAERNLETGEVKALIKADGREIIGLRYLTDQHLHMIAFKIRYSSYERDVYRIGAAHIYDLKRDVAYRFDDYGRTLRVSDDRKRLFMLSRGQVREIDLATGSVGSVGVGRGWEDNYVVDGSGRLIAAQDVNRETGANMIFAADGTNRREIFREEGKAANVRLLGAMPDGKSVIVEDRRDGGRTIRSLGLADGVLSEPLLGLGSAEVLEPVRDADATIVGVSVSGLYLRYEFFDPDLTSDTRNVRASFPGQAVSVVNWSDDKTKMLVSVAGGIEPGRYAIFDRKTRKLTVIAQQRPDFPRADMGEVITIEYPARDGRKIGAAITWPARLPADQRKKLPLVVLPHSMPDGYSAVGFDWIAQFLANEGYAVLQPNYRGSGGQGAEFRAAGNDAFGRGMQHDITDGVEALVQMGWVDGDRVCIAGRGWGGYMALMGGAITPARYRCVAAIGAVTDLPDFMKKRAEGDQRYDPEYGRWKDFLGDPDANITNLDRYSPVNLARQFMAPVLLIHTDLDLFSPNRQSKKMEQALLSQGKAVTLISIQRENEYLLKTENQQLILRELAAFIAANTKPRPPPKPAH